MCDRCPVEETAEKMDAHWPVESHSCECDGTDGRIMFKDGVVIRVPCNRKG